MAEKLEEVMVLNDLAKVGDRVAIAVGAGRYGTGMRTGTILEIPDAKHVKVRVEQTSGYSLSSMPYVKTFDAPKRMVKLGSMTDAL
jgi:hypothetical protein